MKRYINYKTAKEEDYVIPKERRIKMSNSHIGLKHSKETKEKIKKNSARLGKPMLPHVKEILIKVNTGMKRPYANPPHEFDEKASRWAGDNITASGARQWVLRKFGKATKCENPTCHYPRYNANKVLLKEAKHFVWSSKSGQSLRDRDDWFQLCLSCNRQYFLEGKLQNK